MQGWVQAVSVIADITVITQQQTGGVRSLSTHLTHNTFQTAPALTEHRLGDLKKKCGLIHFNLQNTLIKKKTERITLCLLCCSHSKDGNTGHTEHKPTTAPPRPFQNSHTQHTYPKTEERKQKSQRNHKTKNQSAVNLKATILVLGHRVNENVTTINAVPGAGQIYQCLRKGPLCSAWCRLPHHLPPYLVQCLRSCLAMVKGINKL